MEYGSKDSQGSANNSLEFFTKELSAKLALLLETVALEPKEHQIFMNRIKSGSLESLAEITDELEIKLVNQLVNDPDDALVTSLLDLQSKHESEQESIDKETVNRLNDLLASIE